MQALENEHKTKLKDDFVSSYRAIVGELFKSDLKPCDGVHEMLTKLTIPKCVASSGPMKKNNYSPFHNRFINAF